MKNKLLLLCLLLSLTSCSTNNKTETNKEQIAQEEANTKPEKTKKISHPQFNDFSFQLVKEISEDGYGEVIFKNNSNYSIKYIKFYLQDKEGIENIITTSNSLLAQETSKNTTIYFSKGSKKIEDYTPLWLEFNYLDEEKNEHIIRYDYKLDTYEEY